MKVVVRPFLGVLLVFALSALRLASVTATGASPADVGAAAACTANGIVATPASTAASGQPVTVEAGVPGGCASPEYAYFAFTPGSGPGTGWRVIRGYDTNRVATWNTSGEPAKAGYKLAVFERQHGSTAAYEAFAIINSYTLTAPACTLPNGIDTSPASGFGHVGDSGVFDGTSVQLSAAGQGAHCTTPNYAFYVYDATSGQVLPAPLETDTDGSWDTTQLAAGDSYYVLALVWNWGSADLAHYDSFAYASYVLKPQQSCQLTGMGIFPRQTWPNPTAVSLLTSPSGGCANPHVQYYVYDANTTVLTPLATSLQGTRNYSASWVTTGLSTAHKYYILAVVRQNNDPDLAHGLYDDAAVASYRLVPPPTF